jgi:hypothetical protein
MEDIVSRLRALNFMGPWSEAADEIERLRNKQDAEIELYRKILQQIADEASGHGQALAYAALKEKE